MAFGPSRRRCWKCANAVLARYQSPSIAISTFDIDLHNFDRLGHDMTNLFLTSWCRQPMFKYVLAFVILMAAIVHFVLSGVDAQTPGPPPLASPFNPSFGDLMNTLVQPRHAKLGLIGREQNWALAAYEIHQLKAALTNIAILRPRFGNQSVSELMEAMT